MAASQSLYRSGWARRPSIKCPARNAAAPLRTLSSDAEPGSQQARQDHACAEPVLGKLLVRFAARRGNGPASSVRSPYLRQGISDLQEIVWIVFDEGTEQTEQLAWHRPARSARRAHSSAVWQSYWSATIFFSNGSAQRR